MTTTPRDMSCQADFETVEPAFTGLEGPAFFRLFYGSPGAFFSNLKPACVAFAGYTGLRGVGAILANFPADKGRGKDDFPALQDRLSDPWCGPG